MIEKSKDFFSNSEILAVKDIILETVDCEKIYLFGSLVYGTQRTCSDYDIYVVLKKDENPVFVEQSIYRNLSKRKGRHTPVDILAENKSKFYELCNLPTIERKIAREGVLLYDNARTAITRYPKEKEISENMTRKAIDQAQKIFAFCIDKIPMPRANP